MEHDGTLALAEEALRLVQVDPGRALRTAERAVRTARRREQLDAACVAERALGLAAVHLRDLPTATRHLRLAVALGQQAGRDELAAEARMTFAFALNRYGHPQRALAEIDTALDDLGALSRARALAQRAAILHQTGRLEEALADYRAALPALRRGGDLVWVQRVLLNRGVLHAFRHAYGAAARDLHHAEELCTELGLTLPAAFVQENLVLVHRSLGDVPGALAHLQAAERRYRSLDAPHGSLLLEGSELLLSVGLVREAREAAEQAVADFVRTRRHLHTPEARLLLARTAVLDGDPERGTREARLAVRELSRQGREEWAALARCALVLARLELPTAKRVTMRQLTEAAAGADDAGWPEAALEVRLAAGRTRLGGRHRGEARHQLTLASTGRDRGPATRRAKAWYAEALLRHDAGNRPGAGAAAARGLQILDEYRGTMAATDLRARVSALGVELARLGLRGALGDGSAEEVLGWAERGRARHLLERPALPPDDPELAGLMAELRGVVAEQIERQRSGRGPGRLVSRQEALERAIRDTTRRRPGRDSSAVSAPRTAEQLTEALGPVALVEYVELDEVLYAVCLVDGRASLHELGPLPDLRDRIRWLPFALLRLSRRATDPGSARAAVALLTRAGEDLDAALLRPLAAELGSRALVVVPTGVLQSMPWSLLPSAAGRAVTVAPSAALWFSAARRAPRPGPVVVVAGPRLPAARQEALDVAAVHGATPLLDPGATVEAVTGAMRGASLVHLAAHGSVRADNPLFSSLQLSDGPLTVHDLERLHRQPETVVLAACESGRDVVLAGDELLGLSAAFLARGTRRVVASVVPVPDAATAPLMVAFHELVAAGRPAAESLALARQRIARDDTAAFAAAAGFVCIGDGVDPVGPRPSHEVSESPPRRP